MNTSRDVLLEAVYQSIRPLESSIVEQFCKIYNCKKSEIKKPISSHRLFDMVYSIMQQLSFEEAAGLNFTGGSDE